MTLRRRIALTFIALVAVGSAMFSAIALAVLAHTMHAEMDARLLTLAKAIGQIVDDHHGRLSVDAEDISQIKALHGPGEHLNVTDRSGRLIVGERLPAVRAGLDFARDTRTEHGSDGTIVVWQSNAWIGRLVRASIAAFSVVTLALIAAAAFFANLLARAIQGMLDRLEASFENERRFVADASHELRTPLAVMRAETDLALHRTRDGDEYRAALRSIDGEIARLEILVDDLLDTMRDRKVVATERVDAAEVVARAAARMRRTMYDVHVDGNGNGAAIVRGDEASLERAVTAILHNAVTHGGAGTISTRVENAGGWVRIEIADDGPGFGAQALAHATERFWRADSARSRGGTGLGLSIARSLIEAHGGKLRLANGPGGGALVTLLLPRLAESESKREPRVEV